MGLIDKDAFLKQGRKWYCENCDRRKGVKNGRKCFVYEIGEAPCRACDVDDVLDDLECFETIDAVPVRHGEWIENTHTNGTTTGGYTIWHDYTCSVCGGIMGRKGDAYCYNCGARMDGGEHDLR